ncbi:MAG TPA: hypothetical protein VKE70_38420, partial [Candidatus Solibacter sp.]|nr:hypothetical protein [Candidatus Solibacter sp.]
FYAWTATSSSESADWEWGPKAGQLPEHPGPENYYNILTSGFLAGHLYLPIQPRLEILAVKDPYGADTTGIRLQDASLYNGRYYLYYGPAPALTLFMPWRLLSGRGMPHSFAALIYTTCGFVFCCLLLFLLLDVAKIHTSTWMKTLLAVAVGIGNLAPVLLRRPGAVYEVAITCGFCFFTAGLYLMARWLIGFEHRRAMIAVAGLCFGLAAGSRPHYGITAALLLLSCTLWVLIGLKLRGNLSRENILELFWFASGILGCGALLAWYNYARFGSPFEFGTTYQLTGSAIAHVMVHTRHIVPTLYFYVFSQPLWIDQFPYVQLMRQAPAPFGHPEWMPWINLEEEFAGILTIAPICIAGVLLSPLLLSRLGRGVTASVKFVVLLIAGAAMVMLLGIAAAGSISMRYHADYAPELLVAGLFVCVWLANSMTRAGVRKAILGLTVASAVWGTLCSAAISINGYNHSLRTRNPALFQELTKLTGGDPNAIRYPVRQLQFDATLMFPPPSPGVREALVSSGTVREGDVLMVEYVGDGRLRLVAQHWGEPLVNGPEIAIDPKIPHEFCSTTPAPITAD